MPLREDLLTPIAGDNPGGVSLRYDPVYDKIKEARREDDALSQGAWQHELKVADWPLVIRLTQEAIAKRSKDLQLAAWLTEALIKTQGFAGLLDGLRLMHSLIEQFWDGLFPEIEDGDLEFRASPLQWVGNNLGDLLRQVPLCRDGYSLIKYQESRSVGYEDQLKGDAKKVRDKLIKEGKLAPEVFDKSFQETPKAFYAQAEKNLDACLEALSALAALCDEKFGDAAPSFSRLQGTIEEVRHLVHGFLQKKREIEPDPVEEQPAQAAQSDTGAEPEQSADAATAPPMASSAPSASFVMPALGAEPADRQQAVAAVVQAAAYLRKREPRSPAPYLMLRGMRWGELRAALEDKDPRALEAPPTELRQSIKLMALQNKWAELLEAAENVMAMPCSRAWLDLQRFVVEACAALGPDYDSIARAIRSELRSLLRDFPALLEVTLMDDTPAANPETQVWLRELMEEPAPSGSAPATAADAAPRNAPGWQKKFVDSYDLAKDALRKGKPAEAIEILQREVDLQRNGRNRFLRKLQLAEVCLASGKSEIAQPILDDVAAAIDAHKLEEWEDREMIAGVYLTLLKSSAKVQADKKETQKLFDRICRLHPARALEI